jgi:hypothetical protein
LMEQKGVYAALFEKQTQGGESVEEGIHWPWKPLLFSSNRSWAAKLKTDFALVESRVFGSACAPSCKKKVA